MLDSDQPGASTAQVSLFREAIVRHRRWLIAFSIACFLVSFNGRWRIGTDSSIYRGLADSLASGRGYHFGEFSSRQIYPGFPLFLAGVQRLFGEDVFRPIVPLALLNAMALGVIALVYRLLSRTGPRWIAVCATCGMATNARFIKLANEMLTDVPFMLGMMMALVGWTELSPQVRDRDPLSRDEHLDKPPGSRAFWWAMTAAGLALACSMRPAFWFLAVAWLLVACRGIWRGSRRFSIAALTLLLAVIGLFAAVDPRTRGFNPLAGGYEQEVIEVLESGSSGTVTDPDMHGWTLFPRMLQQASKLLREHLPAAILGQELPSAAGTIFSVVVIVATVVFVMRRQPLWGLLVLITLVGTTALSTPPRYYVVLMPFLLVAILQLGRFAGTFTRLLFCDVVLTCLLLMVTGMNVAKIIPFVIEQHSVAITDNSMRFYDNYRGGRYLPTLRIAELIRQEVPEGAKVLAPNAAVVAYLSGKSVLMEREVIPARKNIRRFPEHVASLGLQYAVFPFKRYRDKSPMLARLMERGVIVPGARLAGVEGMKICEVRVIVPGFDWREGTGSAATQPSKKFKKPTTKPKKKPTTKPKKKPTTKPKKKPTTKPKKKKKKPATTPSTLPTTLPATAPSTLPSSRPAVSLGMGLVLPGDHLAHTMKWVYAYR